jgi:hypothetical protein
MLRVYCSALSRAFANPDVSMMELTDIILRIQYEAIDATTLTTFLEYVNKATDRDRCLS